MMAKYSSFYGSVVDKVHKTFKVQGKNVFKCLSKIITQLQLQGISVVSEIKTWFTLQCEI